MDYLPLAQEAYGVQNVWVIHKADDIVIGGAGFLLRRHVLVEVGDGITLALEHRCGKGHAPSRLGPEAEGVVHEIGVKALSLYLLDGEVLCELVDDGADYLHVGQLLGSYIVAKIAHLKNAVNTVFLHYTPHIRYTQVTDWDKLLIGCLRMFIMRLFFTDFSKVCSLASQSHHLLTGFCYNFIVHTEVMHRW